MAQIIIVKGILGTDIRSRSNVNKLLKYMGGQGSYILDMQSVTFISRSVADELCEIERKYSIKYQNESTLVKNMLDIVKEGRQNKRLREKTNSEVIECTDLESLSLILETL